ncbi:MAG: AAA family ATPase [Lachnospiraceae bacterium]|nr:AAA family ATPase [Lachnospiraceae bacterium]
MKIISCKIANFGKLHDRTFSFTDGLNRMTEGNGWGKSTLAAFIKAMLYGFDNDGKRDLSSERKRYDPWQGGTYGGSMNFEAGGKRYLVTRTFGQKPSADTFELRDLDTNLLSSDFGEDIGKELFRIDSESFAKTVLIRQNESAISGTTDDINAKIGNISDSMDLNRYADIESKIKDELNSLSEGKKTGKIYKLKERASEVEALIRSDSMAEETAKSITLRIEDTRGELERSKKEDHSLNELRERAVSYEKRKSERDSYDLLKKEHSEKKAAFLKAKEALNYKGSEDPGEVIARLMNLITDLSELKRIQAGFELSEEEKAKLSDYQRRIPSYAETGMKADRMKAGLIASKAAAGEFRAKEEALRQLEYEYEDLHISRKKVSWLLPVSLLLFTAGAGLAVIYLFLDQDILFLMAGLIPGIAGWVLLVLFILKGRGLRRHGAILRSRIERAGEELSRLEEKDAALKNEVKSLLNSAGILYNEETVLSDLKRLYDECLDHARLSDKYERFRKYDRSDELDRLSAQINALFNDFGITADEADPGAYLNALSLKDSAYESDRGLYEDVCSRLSEFERSHDVRALTETLPEESEITITDIREKQAEIDRRTEALEEALRTDRENLNALRDRIAGLDENRELLASIRGEIEEKRTRVSLLSDTLSFLTKARESLTARYIGPLKRGFSEYYGVITGQDADRYMMDANTVLTVNEAGIQHSVALLSSGYRDLVGLSMRLSFSDAMYPGEKPMLILDDPFVNLDSVNYEGGLRLLDYVAGKYQVLYFTCR